MQVQQARVLAVGFAILFGFSLAGCGGDDSGPAGTGGMIMPGTGGMPGGTGGTPDNGLTCGSQTCAAGQQCVSNVCKTPCMGNSECSGGTCCTGFCEMTQTDRNNCGACAMVCPGSDACAAGMCKPAMCSGVPGTPVNPSNEDDAGALDEDAGIDSSPTVDSRVFGPSGCAPNEQCSDTGTGPSCKCGAGAGCAMDQACSTGGMCQCGSGPGCAMGQACCGDTCVDAKTDKNNCGACGNTCAESATCRAGVCACPNPSDKACDGACVKPQTDENNCGACGNVCAEGATCTAGKCACTVPGEVACNGVCVALNTEDNCAACGNSCEAPTKCTDPTGDLPLGCYCANTNLVPCDGACVALGTTTNCGSCGDACSTPATTCKGSAGNFSCQCPTAGQTACGDECVNLTTGKTSVDPIEDCGKCGVTCDTGATCSAGECSCSSAPATNKFCDENPITGKTDGAYMCIAVTDIINCGACGMSCLDSSNCVKTGSASKPSDYACVCDLAAETHCPGLGCRDLKTDEGSCGKCGNACPAGATCTAGVCDCAGAISIKACDVKGTLTCVDTDSDPKNCGDCAKPVAPGNECCAGKDVNPDTGYDEDDKNCGMCKKVCPSTGCGFGGLFACTCNLGVCN